MKAGLNPNEIDELSPCDVWLKVEAYEEERQERWELTRLICFNVGRFGNSDPKKFPKRVQSFWPLPWDKEAPTSNAQEILRQHALMKARREQLEQKKANP
jgi:hypothetical protein